MPCLEFGGGEDQHIGGAVHCIGGAGHHVPGSSDTSGGLNIDSETGINDNSLIITMEQLASQEENPNANQNDKSSKMSKKLREKGLHY